MEKLTQLLIFQTLIWQMFVVLGNGNCENNKGGIQWPEKSGIVDTRYPGEWIIMDCNVKNLSVKAELWYLPTSGQADTRCLQRTPDGKRVVLNSYNAFNLTDLNSTDFGKYYCKVNNNTKRISLLFEIKEGRPFQRPKILPMKQHGLIHFGEEVKLICKINGMNPYYNIEWYHQNTSVGNEIEFVIKSFDKSNEGVYSCTVTRLDIWKARVSINLRMRAFMKPVFQHFPARIVNLHEGKHFIVNISVDGSPPPSWNCWKILQENVNKKLSKRNNRVFLNITNVSYLNDNGTTFHCNATNMNGSTSKKFWLNVNVKPTLRGSKSLLTLHLNSTKNLTCDTYKANPKPIVTWTYASKNYKNSSKWSLVKSKELLHMVNVHKNILQIKHQKIYKMFYKCTAKNRIGTDSFTWEILDESKKNGIENKNLDASISYLITSIVVSVLIVIILVLIIFVLYKRKKIYGGFYIFTYPPPQDYVKILDKSKSFQEQSHKLPYLKEWEFPLKNITLLKELGSGAFGAVYLAETTGITNFLPRAVIEKKKTLQRHRLSFLRKKNPYVLGNQIIQTAVKTLKENYNENDLVDIQAELKILIHIGEHENILNILGACTKGVTKPLIILEYCPHGNLKEFLRNRRDIYEPEWHEIDHIQLSITDLVVFALQISKGLEFLISRKCIHRDLAARNVLIDERYVAKICDFGMARDIYHGLEYVKKTTGLLPIKWMAIEAIRDRIFNEKTDVWSYGIVIWEIFTLGGTPYPGTDPTELLEILIEGRRMDTPMYCPEEMADIMKSCWREDPEKRPSFSNIVKELEPGQESNNDDDQQEVVYQNYKVNKVKEHFKLETLDQKI